MTKSQAKAKLRAAMILLWAVTDTDLGVYLDWVSLHERTFMRDEKSQLGQQIDALVTTVEEMCGYYEMHGVSVRDIVMYTLACVAMDAVSGDPNPGER
jgi:hypothetical protein